jgi:hypothetical protein
MMERPHTVASQKRFPKSQSITGSLIRINVTNMITVADLHSFIRIRINLFLLPADQVSRTKKITFNIAEFNVSDPDFSGPVESEPGDPAKIVSKKEKN